MAKRNLTSRLLVEQFLLNNQTTKSHNIANKTMSSKEGLDKPSLDVLKYVHSLPQAYDFAPYRVRRNRSNPFEHETVDNISFEDVTIECSDRNLLGRIYRPDIASSAPLPALVYFHGGGFVLGDIESHDKMLAQLCSQSCVAIVSVAYRLAPETVFPGAVEDTREAIEWVFNNSARLSIDNSTIAVGGDSAGANLATVYCVLNQENENYKPCFQLLIYPSIIGNDNSASREQFSDNLLLSKKLLRWFHNHYVCKSLENDPRFNVLKFNAFSKVPPAFVITGGFDPLRDEGQLYVDALSKAGVVTKHTCYTDMFHGFINFGTLNQSKAAVTECARILNGALLRESPQNQ